jgi:hypothetical protein
MSLMSLILVGLVALPPWEAPAGAQNKAPTVEIPKAGVPQIMTMEGQYVRAAYNNEGYAILGYRLANNSINEEWMLLEFGVTLRDGVPEYNLKRDALTLDLPDGKTIPLASIEAHRSANLMSLRNREKVIRDSINYFPPTATRPCRVGYFSDLDPRSRTAPFDEVNLSYNRACVGRLFFQVPGGIKYGQYWLNVKLAKSVLRVPFRILTKDEEKLLEKNYKDIRKQVQDAFRPAKG